MSHALYHHRKKKKQQSKKNYKSRGVLATAVQGPGSLPASQSEESAATESRKSLIAPASFPHESYSLPSLTGKSSQKITNLVELSLLQLRYQALHLHQSQEYQLLQSQENLLEL